MSLPKGFIFISDKSIGLLILYIVTSMWNSLTDTQLFVGDKRSTYSFHAYTVLLPNHEEITFGKHF
jgi:hypothetical protein